MHQTLINTWKRQALEGMSGIFSGKAEAKSRHGEKLSYIHRHRDGLRTSFQDGRVEIASNALANLIRPVALNRKNAPFAGDNEGGRTSGRIASPIETCKINGLGPFAYLKATLEAIANNHPRNRIEDLLPWNCEPST